MGGFCFAFLGAESSREYPSLRRSNLPSIVIDKIIAYAAKRRECVCERQREREMGSCLAGNLAL